MEHHKAPTNKYKMASEDPCTITDNKIEYGIGSGSGSFFDHKIILTKRREAVIMKNDEQRTRAEYNGPHLNTSFFGVKLI